jgi:hypothetical protein
MRVTGCPEMTRPIGMMSCCEIGDWPEANDPCPACGGELLYRHDKLQLLKCTNCDFRCWDDPDDEEENRRCRI